MGRKGSSLPLSTPISVDLVQQQLNQVPKPLIEDFPDDLDQKILKYDIQHNTAYIQGGFGNSFVIKVPYKDYLEVKESFWMDDSRY